MHDVVLFRVHYPTIVLLLIFACRQHLLSVSWLYAPRAGPSRLTAPDSVMSIFNAINYILATVGISVALPETSN